MHNVNMLLNIFIVKRNFFLFIMDAKNIEVTKNGRKATPDILYNNKKDPYFLREYGTKSDRVFTD